MADKFTPEELKDALSSFESGMNAGVSPLLLQTNQLALATNGTMRGTFFRPRPPFRKMALNYSGAIQSAFEKGLWQDGTYYKPDSGAECLMAADSGKLYKLVIGDTSAAVSYVGGGTDQDPNAIQEWMWQSELYTIWNDGLHNPVFYSIQSGSDVVARSNYSISQSFNTYNTSQFVVPAFGSTVLGVVLNDVSNLVPGDILTNRYNGQYQVQAVGIGTADLLNLSASPPGQTVPTFTPSASAPANLFWSHIGNQLPPGRMGAYGMGRNWVCLPDGKQFVASDIEGGASGTPALDYRDAVLYITENTYLAGGGNFSVPGSIGEITAMRFGATLDASLGQGPLQVFTSEAVFSCNAPVDRTTWQSVTNPILTESLIGNGALSQNATILANGDFMFRSPIGLASLILARRDFDTWGNVPQSREVDPILNKDNFGLLKFGSAVIFDNRILFTARPTQADQGVYHPLIIALNFDPISSLRGKAPSIYDGQWIGLNVLKLITGKFGGVDRCFAFTLETTTNQIELYEILKTVEDPDFATDIITDFDGATERSIVQAFSSASIFNKHKADPTNELLKRLTNGEIMVDQLFGTVTFQAYWKPDQWPCWVPWYSWQECSGNATATNPGFRPRMGLGEPPALPCDSDNDRPLREGYTFQFRLVITGQCRFLGAHFTAWTISQDEFAKPKCCLKGFVIPPSARPQTVVGDSSGNIIVDGSGNLLGG